MSKLMEVLKPHRFAGLLRAPGDKYTASGANRRVVEAMGWARPASEALAVSVVAPVIQQQMHIESMPAAEPVPAPVAAETPAPAGDAEPSNADPAEEAQQEQAALKPRRTYKRRDLTAEGE